MIVDRHAFAVLLKCGNLHLSLCLPVMTFRVDSVKSVRCM